jgi:hypothetical protein
MVNCSIRVGLNKNITSMFRLSEAAYKEVRNGLHNWYVHMRSGLTATKFEGVVADRVSQSANLMVVSIPQRVYQNRSGER